MGSIEDWPKGCVPPDVVNRLIAVYSPALKLHHQEIYFPCDVTWFLRHSQLAHINNGRFQGPVLLEAGNVQQESLIEYQKAHKHLALWISDKRRRSGQHPEEHGHAVPVYAHAKLVCYVPEGSTEPVSVEAMEINYMTFYAYNGEYPFCGLRCISVGHHEGDWEHVTVRLQPPPNLVKGGLQSQQAELSEQAIAEQAAEWRLQGVWYNSHRNREGEWAPASSVPRDAVTGRFVAYVARNGHGVYPRAGCTPRLFGVANDFTSDKGPRWIPTNIVRMCGTQCGRSIPWCPSRGCCLPEVSTEGPPDPIPTDLPKVLEDYSLWQQYQGCWGTAPNPTQQSWFNRPEPPVSRTFMQRLVWVCAPDVSRIPHKKDVVTCAVPSITPPPPPAPLAGPSGEPSPLDQTSAMSVAMPKAVSASVTVAGVAQGAGLASSKVQSAVGSSQPPQQPQQGHEVELAEGHEALSTKGISLAISRTSG